MKTGNGTGRFVARWSTRGLLIGITGYAVMLLGIAKDWKPLLLVTLLLWGFSLAAVIIVAAALWINGQNRRTLSRLKRENKLSKYHKEQ